MRVMRTCARLGIRTVAVYSDADARVPARPRRRRGGPYRAGPAAESYLRVEARPRRGALDRRGGDPPGLRVPERERRLRPGVHRGGPRLGGAARRGHAGAGRQGAREGARSAAGVPILPGYHGEDASDAALREAAGAHRLPVAGQGERGRRRARDARGPGARRARRGAGGGAARGGGVVRRRPGAARALPRTAAPRGGPGPRGRPRRRRAPGRARVQRAAAAPEADRGVAVAGGVGRAPGVDGGGRAAAGPRCRVRGRGHGRVPARRRRGVLLPRGQRATAGGAPGDRGRDRARPRRAAAAGRGRRAAGLRPGGRPPRRARDRSCGSSRRIRWPGSCRRRAS